MNEILKEAIETYGTDNQKIKCMEELSELSKEICKDLECNGNLEYIAEEMADCIIMLNQMQMIYENEEQVKKYIQKKVERLSERLRNF